MTVGVARAMRSSPMRCPRCGSSAIRRSMPRSGWERLVRASTSFHYFLCRECEHRGCRWGQILVDGGTQAPHLPSRPVEVRDQEAVRRRRRQVATSIALAAALGAATAVYLHDCRRLSETDPSNPELHVVE